MYPFDIQLACADRGILIIFPVPNGKPLTRRLLLSNKRSDCSDFAGRDLPHLPCLIALDGGLDPKLCPDGGWFGHRPDAMDMNPMIGVSLIPIKAVVLIFPIGHKQVETAISVIIDPAHMMWDRE